MTRKLMRQYAQVSHLGGEAGDVWFGPVPDECPICHAGVYPVRSYGVLIGEKVNYPNTFVQWVFQCARQSCERLFIGTYRLRNYPGEGETYYELIDVAPRIARGEKFSEEIQNTSPTFVEIYNQSIAAEAANLTQIHGLGLRKALEFLIKDFLIIQNPDKKGEIEKKFLGNCIKDHIDDPNLKACADRATWLGNDEAHYVRRWDDKDVFDLKVLIKLTVNWIETILLTRKYIENMTKP